MTNRKNSSKCEKATGKQLSHRNVNKITVSQVAVTLAAFSVCQYVQYMYRLYTLTYVERERERERAKRTTSCSFFVFKYPNDRTLRHTHLTSNYPRIVTYETLNIDSQIGLHNFPVGNRHFCRNVPGFSRIPFLFFPPGCKSRHRRHMGHENRSRSTYLPSSGGPDHRMLERSIFTPWRIVHGLNGKNMLGFTSQLS